MYVKSPSIASTSSTTFWWALQMQTDWVILEPVRTLFGSLGTELWEPNIYIWVFFFKNSIKLLQVTRLLQVAKFLFMYSFTHTNIVCFFNHLPTEIAIFKNVCYFVTRRSVSVVMAFPFLGTGFANILPKVFQTRYSKILKYSEQYIWDHLSGTKVRIWIGSEHDAVFNFSCIASWNLTKTFTFYCMAVLSQESDSELFKQSTCAFYASKILLWNIAFPIDRSFFLGVWHSVNSLSLF